MFVQANVMHTTSKTKKLTVGLAVVAVIVGSTFFHIPNIIFVLYNVVLFVVLPLAVLIINVLLIREVRRASSYAVNLGLHQHHRQHSTSSQSAVPTAMLVTTSLVYVLLLTMGTISYLILNFQPHNPLLYRISLISTALWRLVFAYNFYVYVITGKQFRSDLRSLFCGCSSSSSSATVAHNPSNIRLAERGQN